MNIDKVRKAANEYCMKNNIDPNVLKGQYIQPYKNSMFYIYCESSKTGLEDEGKPIPTLKINKDYIVSIVPEGRHILFPED